ncbi:MAG: methyltransferase domain-containing protein [Pseudomonadota bacterium]
MFRSLVFGAALLCMSASAAASDIELPTGGPFVPTPQSVVDQMLLLAAVNQRDFVIDLGSGDGRIVLTAAQKHRARGMGVDIDERLVEFSNARARRLGLDGLVWFRQQDVLETRISEATVLTLYLLPEMMRALHQRIYSELKPGARVVSHDFQFDGWLPDRSLTVDLEEKYHIDGKWKSSVHLWIVPAKVGGAWHVVAGEAGNKPFTIVLRQQFQLIKGSIRGGEQAIEGRLEGNLIHLELPAVKGRRGAAVEYRGTVDGDRMQGRVVLNGKTVSWTATRAASVAAQ